MSSIDSARHGAASQGLVFVALALAIFAGAASMRILDALLPAIARHFGQGIGTTSMAVTAYALSYGGCQLFYGPLCKVNQPLVHRNCAGSNCSE